MASKQQRETNESNLCTLSGEDSSSEEVLFTEIPFGANSDNYLKAYEKEVEHSRGEIVRVVCEGRKYWYTVRRKNA